MNFITLVFVFNISPTAKVIWRQKNLTIRDNFTKELYENDDFFL